MNCHHARQLISPYLDQQLTGREMLALQDHFHGCASCEREMQSIRQVKALLRGLRGPRPPHEFSHAVALRLAQSEAQPWRVLRLTNTDLPKTHLARPQRGRRLASALVLSCVTIVSFALPFAPEAQNAARSSSTLFGSHLNSSGFAAPSASDVLLGQAPGRVTLVPVNDIAQFNDLAHLSAVPAPPPANGTLTLTGFEAPALGPGAEVMPRDAPFGGVQLAAFRPR